MNRIGAPPANPESRVRPQTGLFRQAQPRHRVHDEAPAATPTITPKPRSAPGVTLSSAVGRFHARRMQPTRYLQHEPHDPPPLRTHDTPSNVRIGLSLMIPTCEAIVFNMKR